MKGARKWLGFWLLAGVILSSVARADTLMVMGDSLSAAYGIDPQLGWVSLMEERLTERGLDIEVVNASVSGETTNGGLARLPDLLELHAPDLVLLELGANDGLRGMPINLIEQNLNTLTDLIQEAGAQPVIIGIHLPPNYGPRYTGQFFELFGSLAQERELPLVPFLLEGVATDWSLMQSDGLHPTAEAQPIILETVWAVIEELLLSASAS